MKNIRHWIFAALFATTIGGGFSAISTPQTTLAACPDQRILTIPTWYNGLVDDNCDIKSPNELGGLSSFIWRIVLNIIEIMLQIVGYLAVGFIIYGGFTYILSTGTPEKTVKARRTITNAVIGLIISIASIAIVNVITGAVT